MSKKRNSGEGTISKRSDGLWMGQISLGYDLYGKRIRKTFYGHSQKEVKRQIKMYQDDLEAGLRLDTEWTFAAWSQQWLESHKCNISATTYEGYKYTLNRLIKYIGQRKIIDIKAIDIENLLQTMRNNGLSDSYLSKARGMLYQIFNKAEANDYVRKNPVRFAEKMRASRPVKAKEAFSDEEVKKLFVELPYDKLGISIRVLLGTGMRMQELLALTRDHIETDGSFVYVRQAVNVVKGVPMIGNTKSRDSVRDIPIPPKIRPCCVMLREMSANESGLVWESKIPGQPFDPKHFRDKFKKCISQIDGVRILTPHSCRHTYVSQMQAMGVDLPTIQSIVGHADLDMTQHYLHVQKNVKVDAAQKYDAVFG